MKHCKYCHQDKSLEEFSFRNKEKKIYHHKCKVCQNEYNRLNKEKRAARSLIYRTNNKEKIKVKNDIWRANNKELCAKMNKDWRDNRMDKEKEKEQKKEYYKKNKKKIDEYHKKWREENKEYMREWNKEYARKQRKENPQMVIRYRLTNRICGLMKTGGKSKSTEQLLGCSYQEFKIYFESLFTEGMAWEKFLSGEIHIDHIKPCCSFDLTKEEEQKKCFHYTNTQPLWAIENKRKLSQDLKMKEYKNT